MRTKSWLAPGTKDEIAGAQKLYGLVNSSIKLANTPGQIAAIQAAVDNVVSVTGLPVADAANRQ
jgi:hypothetical protein